MFALPALDSNHSAHDLDYVLRRAEEEAIAEIRAASAEAAMRHAAMARAYASQALELLNADVRFNGALIAADHAFSEVPVGDLSAAQPATRLPDRSR